MLIWCFASLQPLLALKSKCLIVFQLYATEKVWIKRHACRGLHTFHSCCWSSYSLSLSYLHEILTFANSSASSLYFMLQPISWPLQQARKHDCMCVFALTGAAAEGARGRHEGSSQTEWIYRESSSKWFLTNIKMHVALLNLALK